MQIDRDALNKLLTLNDRQLKNIMTKLAVQSGIDAKEFNIDLDSVASIRRALSSATDEDLKRIAEQYEANNAKSKRR